MEIWDKKAHQKVKIKEAAQIAKIMNNILNMESEVDQGKEHFWVIGLNNVNNIEYIELCTLGLSDRALVAPKETFRLAITKGANRLIVCHNHPSGELEPSPIDMEVTKILYKAGEIIEIKLLDHVIINGNGYYSMAENGILKV